MKIRIMVFSSDFARHAVNKFCVKDGFISEEIAKNSSIKEIFFYDIPFGLISWTPLGK